MNNDMILSQEGTTQAIYIPMYGLATIPLIRKLDSPCKQVWYADNSAAFGTLNQLRHWWDRLTTKGSRFGSFANCYKTWLITKHQFLHNAESIFADSGINITSHGRPYLGAPLGLPEFIEEYLSFKVGEWTSSITILSETAVSQPHAAYSALTHGLSSKWSYVAK